MQAHRIRSALFLRAPHHIVVCLLFMAGLANAQEVLVLSPASFRIGTGEVTNMQLKDAVSNRPLPWNDSQVRWSLIRTNGTQENSDRVPRDTENASPGTLRLTIPGAAVIGVDFRPRTLTLDAAALRRFVRDRADADLPDTVKDNPLVRVTQSAKTIIRAGQTEPVQDGNASGKTGQQVEIRPLFDPTGVGIGSDIPVVAYVEGAKLPNARIIATHIQTGETQECRTNQSGIATFRLDRSGPWSVEFHHLAEATKPEPIAPDGPRPSWVLYSATLSFEARAKEEAK